MIAIFDISGTINGFSEIFNKIINNDNVKSIIILSANNEEFTPENIDHLLLKSPINIIGGIFSSIIYNGDIYNKGTIVIGLYKEIESFVIPNLSDKNTNYDEILESIVQEPSKNINGTMFIFVDGYSTQINNLIDSIFNTFGINNNLIGGGAGYYHPNEEMKSIPCIFTNNGLISNSAVLGWTKLNSTISVEHGWEKICGPFRVTETKGKSIISIDWNPAYDYYTSIIETYSGKKITKNNFFEFGKKYSFGIKRIGSNIIVREPIAIKDTSLIFTVPIPNESLIYILEGDEYNMINAAKQALLSCVQEINDRNNNFILVADCISRYYLLKKNFSKELEALSYNKLPMFGMLTIGEIANTSNHYIDIYNKTCVVGLIND